MLAALVLGAPWRSLRASPRTSGKVLPAGGAAAPAQGWERISQVERERVSQAEGNKGQEVRAQRLRAWETFTERGVEGLQTLVDSGHRSLGHVQGCGLSTKSNGELHRGHHNVCILKGHSGRCKENGFGEKARVEAESRVGGYRRHLAERVVAWPRREGSG